MDPVRFDRLAKSLSISGTRRGALGGLLGGTLALLGLSNAAAKKRRKASAEGPCGDGSGKANACRKHKDCCTRFCDRKKGRCRCKTLGQGCKKDRTCCASFGQPMTCQNRTCQMVQTGQVPPPPHHRRSVPLSARTVRSATRRPVAASQRISASRRVATTKSTSAGRPSTVVVRLGPRIRGAKVAPAAS